MSVVVCTVERNTTTTGVYWTFSEQGNSCFDYRMSSAVVHNIAWDIPLTWVGAINSISPWLQVNKLFINLPTPDFNNLFIVPVTPLVHTTACTSADCLGQLHLAVHHELRPPLLQLARLTPEEHLPVATQPKQPITHKQITEYIHYTVNVVCNGYIHTTIHVRLQWWISLLPLTSTPPLCTLPRI